MQQFDEILNVPLDGTPESSRAHAFVPRLFAVFWAGILVRRASDSKTAVELKLL